MDKNDLKPLIRAMTYLKKYVWYIIFGFICTACVNLFTLSQPLLIKKVMDDVVFAGKEAVSQSKSLEALQMVLLFFF